MKGAVHRLKNVKIWVYHHTAVGKCIYSDDYQVPWNKCRFWSSNGFSKNYLLIIHSPLEITNVVRFSSIFLKTTPFFSSFGQVYRVNKTGKLTMGGGVWGSSQILVFIAHVHARFGGCLYFSVDCSVVNACGSGNLYS